MNTTRSVQSSTSGNVVEMHAEEDQPVAGPSNVSLQNSNDTTSSSSDDESDNLSRSPTFSPLSSTLPSRSTSPLPTRSGEEEDRKYAVIEDNTHVNKKFNSIERRVLIKLTPPEIEFEPSSFLEDAIGTILAEQLNNISDHDKVGVTIINQDNSSDKPVWLSYRPKKDLKADVVLSTLERVIQSNGRFTISDRLYFEFKSTRKITGSGGGNRTKGRDLDVMTVNKRSIIRIPGERNCLAKALVVAIAKHTNDKQILGHVKDSNKALNAHTNILMIDAGVTLVNGEGGIPELKKFQEHLAPDYQIVVYSGLHQSNIIFQGDIYSSKRLYLLYNDNLNHFDVISNITGALSVENFCSGCNKGYHHTQNHKCLKSCSVCTAVPPCPETETTKYCDQCNRFFKSNECYSNHLKIKVGKKTVCQLRRRCATCNVFKRHDHQCFKPYCSICLAHKETGHFCYIPTLKNTRRTDDYMFVFYDIEAVQTKEIDDGVFMHEPNLVCVQQMCKECENVDDVRVPCTKCGNREHTFTGKNCIIEFLEYLRADRPQIKAIYAVAHNGRGYDMQFLLNKFPHFGWMPKIVMNGAKILLLETHHLHFIDSLSFISLPLRQLPKAFGLTCNKGFYPHFFNTWEHIDYVGPYPPPEDYGYNYMSVEEREEFISWYESIKDGVFNNKEELVRYCMQDTNVLRLACREFRRLFLEVGGIDVFREAITIANSCMRVFRKMFLKPETIAIVPKGGYRLGDKCSREAIKWLIYESKQRGVEIQHAGNGREVHLPEFGRQKVDGHIRGTREVFEYLGCYYHGHSCMPNRHAPIGDNDTDTMALRYEQTLLRLDNMKKAGYTVHTMWGCDFKAMLEKNPQIRKDLENDAMVSQIPLEPRDALRGGRTEAICLSYKAKQGEVIKYVDVISLYPFICKTGKFPVGHPTVYVGDKCPSPAQLINKNGLALVKVLPPRTLYHPVLPYKASGKLMFPLCRACAEEPAHTMCTHEDPEDRCLTGVWVTDEIAMACRKGYTIQKVFEFWEYEVEQYDKNTKTGGIFTDYINTFLKLKAEASGYPSNCDTDEEKSKYIERFEKEEGVKLDPSKIKHNPGLRSLAKLNLNSLWGKLGQKENRPKTTMTQDPGELNELMYSPGITVNRVLFVDDETVWVNWSYEDDNFEQLRTVSVPVACYVTAQARLTLYSYMEKLGKRLLYCDTDSLIYVQNDEDVEVPIGEYLGNMSDELEAYGPDSTITEFISGGPKNYAYKVKTASGEEHTVCKVRGITLNYANTNVINFDSMKKLITDSTNADEKDTLTVTNPKKIKRQFCGVLVSAEEKKKYGVVFNKRRRLDDNFSVPHGYISDTLPHEDEDDMDVY